MSASSAVAAGEQDSSASRDPETACLDPSTPFPDDIARLSLLELHVWHSRICRQVEQDLLAPEGPHPLTLDRQQELTAELDVREGAPAPPGAAS